MPPIGGEIEIVRVRGEVPLAPAVEDRKIENQNAVARGRGPDPAGRI
jgi:hypothetical protein